jgi:hypothetical protein
MSSLWPLLLAFLLGFSPFPLLVWLLPALVR